MTSSGLVTVAKSLEYCARLRLRLVVIFYPDTLMRKRKIFKERFGTFRRHIKPRSRVEEVFWKDRNSTNKFTE